MIVKKSFIYVNYVILALFLVLVTIPAAVLAEAGAKALFLKYEEEDLLPTSKSKPAKKSQKTLVKSKTRYSSAVTSLSKNNYIGLQYWIDLLEENGRSHRVTTSHNFRSGDSIKLRIKSKSSGYLYVINQDVTGQQTILYPSKGQEAKLIEAGETYTIPENGKAIFFNNVPGNENLTIALAKYPITHPNLGSKSKEETPNTSGQAMYTACANSKGMFVDESLFNLVCIRKYYSAGTKGMFTEEDAVSTEPASYSVLPSSSLNDGKVMIVDFKLIHR